MKLSDSERVWAGELLTILKFEQERILQMLRAAVRTGESKPDNPNIAEGERVLGYLKPLLTKIESGEGDLELTAVEAGQLDKLLCEAENLRDCWETECGEELEEAQEQGLDDCELSEEARRYKELDDILDILRPLSKTIAVNDPRIKPRGRETNDAN
jgi:hypothetical protein